MNPSSFIINARNCSWHGTRISPYNSVVYPSKPGEYLTFEIDYHYGRDKYSVHLYHKIPKLVIYRNGHRRTRMETWGKFVFFGDNVKSCIDFIYKEYGIIYNLLNFPVRLAHSDEVMEARHYIETLYFKELV